MPELVKISWDDAHGDATDTKSLADLDHKPYRMLTVGWLLRNDDIGVSVANEQVGEDNEGFFRGITFIPKSLVHSIVPLKYKRKIKEKPGIA